MEPVLTDTLDTGALVKIRNLRSTEHVHEKKARSKFRVEGGTLAEHSCHWAKYIASDIGSQRSCFETKVDAEAGMHFYNV